MKGIGLIIIGLVFFFSGCSTLVEPKYTPEEKRMIYNSVQEDIVFRSAQGEKHLAQGYYSAALEDFEAVNFYERSPVIPLARIKKIAEQTEEKSTYFYERGIKLIESDKKQALMEFNRLMRCNPKYKDGKTHYEQLKNDKEIGEFLLEKVTKLESYLQNNTHSHATLKALNQSFEELAKYDDTHPSVEKAKLFLDEYRNKSLEQAVRLYEAKKYDEAINKFEQIIQIFPKESTAQKYIDQYMSKQEEQKRIRFEHIASVQELQKKVKLARSTFEQKEYCQASKYASKVLEDDPNNKEGQYIFDSSTKYCAHNIPALIRKGIHYYKQQRMENALEAFQSVLEVDANNTTSIAYIKKIKRQLQTIKNLK